MAIPTLSVVAEDLAEARTRTLALVEPLSDDEIHVQHTPVMSPLVWDLAHIAAYEDLWINHRHGGRPLLRDDLAAMYDAFETPRTQRGDLPLLCREEAVAYLCEVRELALDVIEHEGLGDGTLVEMVLRHEHQHNETMLQAIDHAGLDWAAGRVRTAEPAADAAAPGDGGLEPLDVPAGRFVMGLPDGSFGYDNERPARRVELPAFAIGRTPVTHAAYREWMERGGYGDRASWSPEGWAWRVEHRVTAPGDRHFDARHPDSPVVHVSFWEADAFARAHGARLPTEAEWERSAAWDADAQRAFHVAPAKANLDLTACGPRSVALAPAAPSGALGMLGDVWEWTQTAFHGYPGFTPYPYPEYSEVFFGTSYRVLRGGSWATRTRVARPTFRNWDLPVRRQLFAGFRLAWDA